MRGLRTCGSAAGIEAHPTGISVPVKLIAYWHTRWTLWSYRSIHIQNSNFFETENFRRRECGSLPGMRPCADVHFFG